MSVHGADLAGLRIGLLTASASRLGGGVAEVVVAQARLIRSLGAEPLVFALADAHTQADCLRYEGAALHAQQIRGPAQIGFAPGLVKAMMEARLDCLHLHGIWMYPSRAATAWSQQSERPFLISPHGMLDPWITARGRWKKALARRAYERPAWRAAAAFHALTTREAEDIRNESGRAGSLVIANAAPPAAPPPRTARAPHILYIGRIHPKKNLTALLDAWQRLEASGLPEGARLTIAGWGADQDVAALERRMAHMPPSARFVGPAFGAEKSGLLASARFLVLPSLSEGLPMAVLEAWAAGTPAIMTSECNLPEGFAHGAALETGIDAASITVSLTRALAMTDLEWLAMARAAHGLASGPFSAETIAGRWAKTYRWLASGKGATWA